MWKEKHFYLRFFACRYSPKESSIWDYYFWLVVPTHAQLHPHFQDLLQMLLVVTVFTKRLKLVQNEDQLILYEAPVVFPQLNTQISNDLLKCALIQSDCRILWSISMKKQSMWNFLHGDMASETTTFVLVWSGLPSHAQTCLNLSGVNLVRLWLVLPRW